MLPQKHRLDKKNLSALLKEPHGKVFSDYFTLLYRTTERHGYRFAPVLPKKLKLGSIKMHYMRRVLYSTLRELLRTSPELRGQIEGHDLVIIAKSSLLPLSFSAKQDAFASSLGKIKKST